MSAPASASTRQISWPIPLEAPVTRAFLSVSEKRATKFGTDLPPQKATATGALWLTSRFSGPHAPFWNCSFWPMHVAIFFPWSMKALGLFSIFGFPAHVQGSFRAARVRGVVLFVVLGH